MTHTADVRPYTALATGYDLFMSHVDYDQWSAYVHTLIQRHGDEVRTVLEVGCGTGSMALRLQPLGPYQYVASDQSPAMLREARAKFAEAGQSIPCVQADFTDLSLDALGAARPFDAVVLVYDGLNYMQEPSAIADFLHSAHRVLRDGGLLVFDQSTPANSEENAEYFTDEGGNEQFAYVRESQYDPASRCHTTTITMTVEGRTVREEHVQRAYPMHEIGALLEASPLRAVAAYDDCTLAPAHEQSHRIHWVARRVP